jgi:hypothetical protein
MAPIRTRVSMAQPCAFTRQSMRRALFSAFAEWIRMPDGLIRTVQIEQLADNR